MNSRLFLPAISALAVVIFATSCASPEERARAAEQRRQRDASERARENLERQREMDRDESERARERFEDLQEERKKAAEEAARYRVFEEEYARQLGKRPSQLTREERDWIRSRF